MSRVVTLVLALSLISQRCEVVAQEIPPDQMPENSSSQNWLAIVASDPLVLNDLAEWPADISVDGWVAQGSTWNPDSPADRFNGFLSNNDRANEYQLNQIYLALRKEVDTESDEVSFGFGADLIYGADAFTFQSNGWDDHTVSTATAASTNWLFQRFRFRRSYRLAMERY
jgi:hypothetical protein